MFPIIPSILYYEPSTQYHLCAKRDGTKLSKRFKKPEKKLAEMWY